MHLLHFYKTYKPDSIGGVEQFIGQLCCGSAKLGITSEVLTLSRDTSTIDSGDHLHHRAKLDFQIASSSFSLSVFRRFAELAKRADIIHYHFPWPLMDMVHFVTRVKKPTVVTYHSDIVRQKKLLYLYRPLMHRFLASVNCIVATSPHYVKTSDVLMHYADKVKVIPIGLDKAAYAAVDEKILPHWAQRVGHKFFLFVGQLRYYKGLPILLAALVNAGVKVVIVGTGPLEQSLKQQAKHLGLSTAQVDFVGAVTDEDKIALLTLCYGIVFPSHLRSEAFGISLLEGAMFGKPLISTEIGTGTSYINLNGQTGLVIPPNDPDALRDAMNHLWHHPALAAQMGQQAQARYRKLFTAGQMVKRYVELYQGL